MSIDHLEKSLQNLYDVKCFVDLAELSTSPTHAYKHFDRCHQEKFSNNDRLVFYTSKIIPVSLLQHLYQATDLIDISNYFVLICSPYDIDQQTKHFAKLNHTNTFQTLQVEIETTEPIKNNFFVPNTLCPLPWRHLEVSPSGEIRPCCVYQHSVGHVKKNSLQHTFNNHSIQDLRQQLLDGKKPSGCNNCWASEEKGLTSSRYYHMRMLQKELLTVDLDSPTIKSLDIKPGNTCNFKCRICNPLGSSLFAQEVKASKFISIESFNWPESNLEIVDEIVKLLPNLTNIDMYGGEPFLLKSLLHIIQQAVEQGHASQIRLHYNSNGSVYPETLIEYWKHFNHVDIQFSIDNIGDRFELERGGSWQQVDSNIKKLIALNLPNIKISVMPAISIMNVLYLDEIVQWANDLGLAINVGYVTEPAGFDLKNLTAEAKKLITEKFQHRVWPEMKNILNYILSGPDSDGQEFIKLCKHFDSLRNQNFADSHPEIAKAMGYVYNSNI